MERPPLLAYQGKGPYVFVSYAHADEAEVFVQIRWLQDHGVNVWYDTTGIGPGNEWSDEIAKAIKGADRLLYFVTPNSVASEHCRRELSFAQSEGRQVVVCHLRATNLPDGLRLSLDNRQAIRDAVKVRCWPRFAALTADRGRPGWSAFLPRAPHNDTGKNDPERTFA